MIPGMFIVLPPNMNTAIPANVEVAKRKTTNLFWIFDLMRAATNAIGIDMYPRTMHDWKSRSLCA